MQLEFIDPIFNPDLIVSDFEIFSRKNETIEGDDGFKDTRKKFSDEGLFSKRIFGDGESSTEYSCECGKYSGEFYKGMFCDKCFTEVTYVQQSVDRCGWIDLSLNTYNEGKVIQEGKGFHLIKYLAYTFLEKLIGRENLKNIIHTRGVITISGELDTEELEALRNQSDDSKYYFYGIEEFYNNYEEILDYYYELYGKKNQDIYNLVKNKNTVFTNKILVINPILRPANRTADGIKLDEINIKYQAILKNLQIIKDSATIGIVRESIIEQIQAEFFQLCEKILENIKGKSGLIRNQICGTRVNFSSRCVISPASPGRKMNELEVPYRTFLENYKFEIIGILSKIKNIEPKQAELIWYNAVTKFNKEVYNICQKMVEENYIGMILNRNPTIAVGSILFMRVAKIKEDINDATLSLSNTILSLLAADYDGDVLNLVSVKDRSTRNLLERIFSPKSFIIDPNTGNFNNSLNLERDQVLGLNSLIN